MNLYLSERQRISRPLVLFVSGFMAALAVFCYFFASAALWTAAAAALLGGICIFLSPRFPFVRRAAIVFAGICAAGCVWSSYNAFIYQPALSLAGKGGNFTGYVQAYPELFDDYTRVEWKIESINGEQIRPFKVRLYLDGDYSQLQPGDELCVETQLEIPESTWRFDTRRYLNSHGIYLKASAASAQLLAQTQLPFTARLQRIAREIDAKLREIMPEREAGLMTALLFGDETGMETGFENALRLTGLSHITAVSGMNVAFLVGIILTLLRRRAGCAVAVPVVLAFILMTGAPASVVRAGIMQIMWLLSFYLMREPDSLTSLFVSAAFILFSNPFAIADLSLLLSFFATLGIILYGGPFYRAIKRHFHTQNKILLRFCDAGAGILATTLTAQIFILPVQAVFFGEISLLSPLSNLLVLWASEYAFTMGVAAALAGFVWLPLGVAFAWIPRVLCSFILYVVPLLSKIPFAAVSAKSIYVAILLVFGYLLFALVRTYKHAPMGLAAVCMAGMCAAAFLFTALQKQMTAIFAVVSTVTGQSAVVCQADTCLLFNCGGSNEYAVSGIEAFLWENGRQEIDMLVISSYRRADSANVPWALENYHIGMVYLPEPKNEQDMHSCALFMQAAQQAGTQAAVLTEDLHLDLEGIGVDIYVNHSDDRDNGRLLLSAQAAGQRLVALGAIQAENLGRMLSQAPFAHADILALGDYYSSRALPGAVMALAPDCAVISAYYEIDTDLIYTLSRAGAQVITTQRQGRFEVRLPRIYKTPE
mgnify:CR=1 FL=1